MSRKRNIRNSIKNYSSIEEMFNDPKTRDSDMVLSPRCYLGWNVEMLRDILAW